jgi:hypothetical protein
MFFIAGKAYHHLRWGQHGFVEVEAVLPLRQKKVAGVGCGTTCSGVPLCVERFLKGHGFSRAAKAA